MDKRFISFTFTLMFSLSAVLIHGAVVAVEPDFPATTICVDPPTSTIAVGQNFAIHINISNVADLYGWEVKLGWNSSILDAVNVIEGNFLKGGGNTTFFAFKINNTEGYILVDCTLLGDASGVSGDGILATVEFYAEGEGESILDLYDTILVSSFEQPIAHQSTDGYGYFTLVHDVAIISVAPSKTIVGQGYNVSINITIENQGTYTENFNVTAYANTTIIATFTNVTLASGNSITITFTWDTTGFAKGNYTISATATLLPDETDNTYMDCWVLVTILGDVNGDGVVNVLDIIIVLTNVGPVPPNPPECDINGDGTINILDIIIVLINVG